MKKEIQFCIEQELLIQMKAQTLGTSDLQVLQIGYGTMAIGGPRDYTPHSAIFRSAGLRVLEIQLDASSDLVDHADIYCKGNSEEVFADFWRGASYLCQQIQVQTECEFRFGSLHRFACSCEQIIAFVQSRLKSFSTDYINALLVHRLASIVEPEEVARAFDDLKQSGEVRWYGVSNYTASQPTAPENI